MRDLRLDRLLVLLLGLLLDRSGRGPAGWLRRLGRPKARSNSTAGSRKRSCSSTASAHEINKRVAGSFLAPKIFSSKVKKGLKLFFHLKGRACSLDE